MISWQLLSGNWTHWYFGKRKFNRILTPCAILSIHVFLNFQGNQTSWVSKSFFRFAFASKKSLPWQNFLEPKILVSRETLKPSFHGNLPRTRISLFELWCDSGKWNLSFHELQCSSTRLEQKKEVKINNKFTNDVSPMSSRSSLTCRGRRNPTTSLLS